MSDSWWKYSTLILEGEQYGKFELLKISNQKLEDTSIADWEKSIWKCIANWLNDNDFIMVNTSGSTGKPKPIRIPKNAMLQSAKATGKHLGLNPLNKALLCLSAQYIAGKMMIVRSFVLGLDLILAEPKHPSWRLVENISFVAMVPLQVQKVLKQDASLLKKSLRLIIGGAPVSNQLEKDLQGVSAKCFATYGMTETVTHIALKQLNKADKQTYFQALPNVELSQDNRSCLVINAKGITSQPIVTNDIVELHSPKIFSWLGRFDNVINSGGIKLHPEIIERKLESIIQQRYFITSLPDDNFGEQVVLVIEKSTLLSIEYQQLMQEIGSVLDRFEIPKMVYYLESFVETVTGKIQRQLTLDASRVYAYLK